MLGGVRPHMLAVPERCLSEEYTGAEGLHPDINETVNEQGIATFLLIFSGSGIICIKRNIAG